MHDAIFEEAIEAIRKNLCTIVNRAKFHHMKDFLEPAQEALKIIEDLQTI